MESASRRSNRLTIWFDVMLKVCLPFYEELRSGLRQDRGKNEHTALMVLLRGNLEFLRAVALN